MPNRPTVSVAMIARNEETNLPRTLAALHWVDQIVIVDSGSTDRTPEIAREFNAEHTFNRDFKGHAEQKNIAVARCTSDWILLLDADEVVTPPLAAEIQSTLALTEKEAFFIPRLNLFLTRWMRHGGLFPDQKLRLFRRGVATVDESIGPHGTPQYTPSYDRTRGLLHHHLQHHGYPDFAGYLDHMNEYSSATTPSLNRRTARAPRAFIFLQAFTNPLFGLVKNYIFRLGFLDGPEALVFHLNHAAYVHWKYVKVWQARKLADLHASRK